jgi:DNA polymerase-3 subunit gamma/tau
MTYQVLARKWRPQEFSSLIGQEPVVTALRNALADGRVAQAYLFSGIRGVGKTTAARLLAKALNCERGLRRDGPCNDCDTCREIAAGADLDVLEIDAATYSKVEQVRELAESLRYGPTRDRYKVVVIDEIHRLSRQAFDALLKIVEEPPPRLVFVFATTEIDAVPATILSRCQEFHFRRVGAAELVAHLAEICRRESITASDRALRLVARAGEGSVRDAVALLDQLATYGSGTVSEEAAQRLVGGLDLALFGRVLDGVLDGDARAVSTAAREVEQAGWDPRQVYAHFLAYGRDALHLALGGSAEALDLPEDEARTLAERAARAGYENLLRLLHQLLSSEATVRRSDAGALALELAWLRAAELPKLVGIEELLARGGVAEARAGEARSRESRAPRPAAAPAADRAQPGEPGERAAPAAPPAPDASRAAPPPAPREEPAAATGVTRFREELATRRPILAAQLADARLEHAGGELRIALASDPLAAAQLARPSNRELLDAAVVAAFGAGTRWRLVDAPAAPPPAPDEQAERELRERAAADPGVQAVLDVFGGAVAAVGGAAAAAAPPRTDPSEESD